MPGVPVPSTPGVTASKFSLTIDGVEIAQFSELMGITTEVELAELQSGELSKRVPRRVPPTVTLRRGHTKDMGIFTWHESVVEGQLAAARKSASLTCYGSDGKPVAKYFLENCWPSRIEIGRSKPETGEGLPETVTLRCDRLQRISV
jgi:phage tail-like protein